MGFRWPEVTAQSTCPSVRLCGVEGAGAHTSEYQPSALPALWASAHHSSSLSLSPPPKWGGCPLPHRLGGEEGSCISELFRGPHWKQLPRNVHGSRGAAFSPIVLTLYCVDVKETQPAQPASPWTFLGHKSCPSSVKRGFVMR